LTDARFQLEVLRILAINSLTLIKADLVEDYKTYMCAVCGFIYDEALGWPEDGIPPGTRWEDVPDTWGCPECGATKEDFEMEEI
jgi:rubredoxin